MPKVKHKVDDFDIANLRESDLNDATIRRNGLYTENDALHFPYRNLRGSVNGYTRWRPHNPTEYNGKLVKYLQKKGSPNRPYFPAESVEKLRDSKDDIFVPEGEKKSLRLAQGDYTVMGLGGVWNWKVKGKDELIPEIQEVDFTDRDIYTVFDYDEKPETRRHVDLAERRFAKALRDAGANEVFSVKIPPGPNGEKQGCDDFIAANGEDAFRDLVEQAQPVPDCCTPMRIASGRTDAANASRLVDKFGEQIRWVGSWDKWLIWNGQRWQIDCSLRTQAFAKTIAAILWKEISAEVSKGNLNDDTIKSMVSFATKSNGANCIRNTVSLARSEPGINITIEELDQDPWLLNCQNGTLDLQTGELREHRREDFITKITPVTFDSDAECPIWEEFLQVIFDDNDELIDYMRRLIGYCLTGVTEEHILPFLYGTGANGKSTLAETVLKLLGSDYAMKAPPDLLMARRGESHPTDRADLFGKRLVACIETEDGRRMAESLVKELTGGDRVRARRMREDFWEFAPTHHVWLAGNHKPTITGNDHGIWRRIKLIPFEIVIPDAEQDKKLYSKLAGELSGILNWAVEGCLDWQRDGMQEPEIVSAATKEYSDEMDDLGRFLDEHCELGPDFMAPATLLYQQFLTAMPGCRVNQKVFGQALGRRGFARGRITKGINKSKHGWKGLRLRSDARLDELAIEGQEFLANVKTKKGGSK